MYTVSILCPGPSLERVSAGDLFGYRVAVNSAILRDDFRPDAWCSLEGPDLWIRKKWTLSPWPFETKPVLWVPWFQRDERRDDKGKLLCRGWRNAFPDLEIERTPQDDEINSCMPWESNLGSWCSYTFTTAMAISLWRGARTIHLWGVDQSGHEYAPSCVNIYQVRDGRDPKGWDWPVEFERRWARERPVTERILEECRENGIEVVRHAG